jgi:hypothetical protein
MEIVALFCDSDDFCLQFEPLWHQHLVSDGSRQRWRKQRLWLSEGRTIVVSFHQSGYRGVSTIDPGGECFYAASGCSMSLTKADLRVLARGVPASHSPIRTKLSATAVNTCCK